MRQASTTMSCVAEAKAPMKAMSAKVPMLVRGSTAASAKKVPTSSSWHRSSQLRRRPRRSRPGSGTRSTSGDHRNLKA